MFLLGFEIQGDPAELEYMFQNLRKVSDLVSVATYDSVSASSVPVLQSWTRICFSLSFKLSFVSVTFSGLAFVSFSVSFSVVISVSVSVPTSEYVAVSTSIYV